jgi:hypothetical protein
MLMPGLAVITSRIICSAVEPAVGSAAAVAKSSATILGCAFSRCSHNLLRKLFGIREENSCFRPYDQQIWKVSSSECSSERSRKTFVPGLHPSTCNRELAT